jgi:benzoyl-CoA reductase/2-hydroxyglutaryl-CoA dehydratase subunit BcrC/BadD/HgdB
LTTTSAALAESDRQELLKPFSAFLDNPAFVIREWQAQGGKIAGYLSNNVPLEILHAAGLLPVHLSGDPALQPEKADKFMERAFDPITKSVFDRLLRGHFDELDLIVLPRGNDAQQRLYYYLCELARNYPEFDLPEVTLVDLLNTLRPSTDVHNQRRLAQTVTLLENNFSCLLTEDKLSAAIRDYNQARMLLTEFTTLRARSPLSLNGQLAFTVYQAARSMPVTAFNEAMQAFLPKARNFPAETARKVILAGNGLDYPGLYQLIESQGVSVVGDYHAYGNHFLNGQISSEEAPLAAISHYYQRDSRSCRSFEVDPQELLDFARAQGADAVIFYFLFGEEAWTWQQPKQKQLLDAAGIPSTVFYDQPYALDQSTISASLQTLIDKI